MPFCLRILLESVVRNRDEFHINDADVQSILNWRDGCEMWIPFKPARIVFQDFT
jgi:aconitate hydratase